MSLSTVERNKPPYRVVYEHFRKRAKNAGEGMLIPSRAELAKQFNVAEGTISRALGLLKNKGFAYGQQGKGTYICDRRQKSSKLQQVGFYTYALDSDIIRQSRGFDEVFSGDDYSISIHSSQMNLKKYKSAIEHIGSTELSGVVLLNPPSLLNSMEDPIDISFLAESGIPVVSMGGSFPGLYCDKVEHTRRDSARRMAEYAVARGCRVPGIFLDMGSDNEDNEEFLNEFRRAFMSHDIEIKRENILLLNSSLIWRGDPDFSKSAYDFTKKGFLDNSKCDWLMFHGDGSAVGVLRALRENGVKVPEQIKLLSGYRGSIPEEVHEKVTAVDTNIKEQSYLAAKLLKRRIEGYDGPIEVHYVAGELIEGETT